MKFIFLGLMIAFWNIGVAQDCSWLKEIPQGIACVYETKDKKGEILATETHTFSLIEKRGPNAAARVKFSYQPANDKKVPFDDFYEIQCKDDQLHIEMTGLLTRSVLESLHGRDLEIEGDQVVLPASLENSAALRSATATLHTTVTLLNDLNTTLTLTDRTFEGMDTVETPAGSFECYKVSQTHTVEAGLMKLVTKVTDYYRKEGGFLIVKSEYFNKANKLKATKELTQINPVE